MALMRFALYTVLWSAVSGVLGSSDTDAANKAFGSQNVPGWFEKTDNPLVQTAFLGAKLVAEAVLQSKSNSTLQSQFQPDGIGPGGSITIPSPSGNAAQAALISTVPVKAAPAKKTVVASTAATAGTNSTASQPALYNAQCPA